jgi:hypothetical protein
MRRQLGWVGSFVLCSVAACSSNSTAAPAPPPVEGTLTVDWTIDGSTDPDKCNQSAVTTIDIVVTRDDGSPAGTFQQACPTFATSIPLAQGSYTARATLLDGNGVARTTSVAINPFTLAGNDELRVPIDFPANSFE